MKDFKWLINTVIIKSILTPITYLIMAWATVMFFWGLLDFFRSKEREQAHKHVMYGIIGLFIFVAYQGLVWVVDKTFDLDNESIQLQNNNTGGEGYNPDNDYTDNIDDQLFN